MPEFGKFSMTDFVNGSSPALNADNLNEIKRIIELTDAELARSAAVNFSEYKNYFYWKNTKVLYAFANHEEWTEAYPSRTTISDEEDNQIIGNTALKITNDLSTEGWMSVYQTLSATVDLTKMQDGVTSSTTDDIFVVLFYVSDADMIGDIEFKVGDDSSNCYKFDVEGNFDVYDGWNVLFLPKTDFSTVGTPTGWNSIDYIRIAPYTYSGYDEEYLYFQYMMIIRYDPDNSGYPSPCQKYMGVSTGWENVFAELTEYFMLYYDHQDFIEKIGMMKPNGGQDASQIHLYCSVIEFISKFEMYCKLAGETCSVVWYYNNNNYAEVYIKSDTFYLDVYEASVKTSTSQALTNGIIKNERIYIYFEKEADTFRAILYKDDEIPIILEYETSISGDTDGCIYLGQNSSIDESMSFVTDFEIGHKSIGELKDENLPRFIRMYEAQELDSDSLTNVPRLYSYLPSHGLWKVDLYLVCSCDSASPDIRISWELTDCANYSNRCLIGPEADMTSSASTKVKMSQYEMGSNAVYGIDAGGNESLVRETFIVLTGDSSGKIQLKASQWNDDSGNPVTINSKSFIIITPIVSQGVDLS
jgi:hypothetical protein